MEKLFVDQVAVITGASRGIGRATARYFAGHGAKVVLIGRATEALTALEAEIKKQDAQALALPCDIRLPEQVEKAFRQIESKWGKVDTLINNAGVLHNCFLEEMPFDLWQETLATNLTGAFLCAQQAFRHMREKGGVIINVSSLSIVRGVEKFPGYSAYIASKHGIIGLTEALAVEGKPFKIRSNAIAPGAVQTDLLNNADPSLKPTATPEDIAKMVGFLAHPQNQILSGSVLEIFCNG